MANFSDGPGGTTLTGTAAFPGTAQVIMTFNPRVLTFESLGTDDVSYSFDGTNVHGTIASGVSVQKSFNEPRLSPKRVWFRDEGGGGTAQIRTTAYDY